MKQVRPDLAYIEIPNGDIMDDPTNMFIVGADPVILIDPGAMAGLSEVLETLDQIGNPAVASILLTHVHIDHAESAEEIRRITGAPVRFHDLELPELSGSGHSVTLDQPIKDGEIIEHAGYRFEAVLTPGHAAGHLSFIETDQNFALVGDLVTGWGSSAIFPPWGDLEAYVNSMSKVADRGANPLLPSHGEPVTNGPEALRHFVRRRLQREEQIVEILQAKPLGVGVDEVRDHLYSSVPQDLLNDVTGNVILHLEKLEREGRIQRLQANRHDVYALVCGT